jgi:hypothetical protein
MNKLTRQGARNLTATLDRIASVIQENPKLLGVDHRIASDFAYRCDLLSDAIETTASTNFPKSAADAHGAGEDEEGMSVDHGWEGSFDANSIGDEVPGPLEIVEPPSEPWMDGHFTQEKFTALGDLQTEGKMGPVNITASIKKLETRLANLKKAEAAQKAAKTKAASGSNFHGFNLTK